MASAFVTTIGPPKWGQDSAGYKTRHHIFSWDNNVSISLTDEGLAYLVRYAVNKRLSLGLGLTLGLPGLGEEKMKLDGDNERPTGTDYAPGPPGVCAEHRQYVCYACGVHVPEDVHRTNYQGEDPDEAYDRAREEEAAMGEETGANPWELPRKGGKHDE